MPSPRIVRRAATRAKNSEHAWIRALFTNARLFYRWTGRTVPFLHLGWVANLRDVRWEGERLVLEGWAYTRGTGYEEFPEFEVYFKRKGSRQRIIAQVSPLLSLEASARARAAEVDYSNTGFRAVVDLAEFGESGRRPWHAIVAVTGSGHRYWGRLKRVNRLGSPAVMAAREVKPGVLALPRWDDQKGLVLECHEITFRAQSASTDRSSLEVVLTGADGIESAMAEGIGQQSSQLEVVAGRIEGELPAPVPVIDELTEQVLAPTLRLSVKDGRRYVPVYATPGTVLQRPRQAGEPLIRASTSGQVEVIQIREFVEVDEAEVIHEPRLGIRLRGTFGGELSALRLSFVGPIFTLPVELREVGEGRFEGFVPLTTSVWDGPDLPVARGGYALIAETPQGPVRTFVTPSLVETNLTSHGFKEMRLRLDLNRTDQLRVAVLQPRRDDELGSYRQLGLWRGYRDREYIPAEAVYFESFFGKNATCNPRAIDREIARRFPDMPRYWAVMDYSIAVPEGAIPVLMGSKEWWDARGACRYIITNEWLRARFVKRPYQTVVQTWHGSMYKKIGLDRTGMSKRHLAAVREERSKWDYFISQNLPGTDIIASAYDFDKENILELGYPRNDELHDASEQRVARIRERLGVAPGKKLVMYAPTWRDQQSGEVDLLNLAHLAEALGDEYVMLLRSHVRVLAKSQTGAGLIDVSTYPQVAELFLVADALITDYSSMMFDFSVTGKPMIFFTPDIDDYRNAKVRGVYFDLVELAPGPVVRTQDEVESRILDLESVERDYADKYAAWQKRFNHHDDGKASERVVDFLFGAEQNAAQ